MLLQNDRDSNCAENNVVCLCGQFVTSVKNSYTLYSLYSREQISLNYGGSYFSFLMQIHCDPLYRS